MTTDPIVAERIFPWVLRVLWAVLPITAGPALAAGLDGRSTPVVLTAAIGLWVGWAAVVVATLVPHPVGLTALRLLAPAAVVAVVVAVSVGEASTAAAVAGIVSTALVTLVAYAPATGMLFVNGPAYPNERRYPLHAPGPLLIGPLELGWVLAVIFPAVGIMLMAAGVWVAGIGLLVVSGAPAALLVRAMHGLARRWVVFVPAGLVLHDPIALADPVLFQRRIIERLRPAPADTDSLDLTQRSPGLILELLLREKVPMVRIKPGDRLGESGSSARLLFTPTRPGAVLADAAKRRLPVG